MDNKPDQSKKEKSDKDVFPFDTTSIILLVISGIILILAFFMPHWLTRKANSGIDFSSTGQIGDTIGGIMSPFIAIIGIIITFLAFYIQYQANERQKKNFKDTITENKNESRLNKFENQFYEMLRLHKENVNEFSLTLRTRYSDSHWIENQVKGREVFSYYLDELGILYKIIKSKEENSNSALWFAYNVFNGGIDYALNREDFKRIKDTLEDIKNIKKENTNKSPGIENKFKRYNIREGYNISDGIRKFVLFEGRGKLLNHYFRHLFQTVKFVANQNESFITYEEKRNYLRILRAQLSDQEQVLLFYNFGAGFGSKWENDKNKFFSDYRMIHNLWNHMIFDDFDLTIIFKLNEKNYRVEKDRVDDFMFEFEGKYDVN